MHIVAYHQTTACTQCHFSLYMSGLTFTIAGFCAIMETVGNSSHVPNAKQTYTIPAKPTSTHDTKVCTRQQHNSVHSPTRQQTVMV